MSHYKLIEDKIKEKLNNKINILKHKIYFNYFAIDECLKQNKYCLKN